MQIRWLTIFLDFPGPVFGAEVAFWREVTGSGLSASRGEESEFATLLPAAGDAYLRVQRVREGNGGCHLDLHIDGSAGSVDEAAGRAVTLGALIRHREDDLVILDSPGGFTFCLVPWDEEKSVPGPVILDDGGASRLDQLCLDIPPDAYESECSFWAALSGWELRQGSLPEFAYLERPAGMPARLLLQRRESAGTGDLVSGHIDFSCGDPSRLARRHVVAGAKILRTFPHWLMMADPSGRDYCLTMRDPETGKLRDPAFA
jgi:hypothetical protein